MEDLIVGVGLIGRALSQGVLLHSFITDPHHVKCRSTGCCDHVVTCFGKDPIETLRLQVK